MTLYLGELEEPPCDVWLYMYHIKITVQCLCAACKISEPYDNFLSDECNIVEGEEDPGK